MYSYVKVYKTSPKPITGEIRHKETLDIALSFKITEAYGPVDYVEPEIKQKMRWEWRKMDIAYMPQENEDGSITFKKSELKKILEENFNGMKEYMSNLTFEDYYNKENKEEVIENLDKYGLRAKQGQKRVAIVDNKSKLVDNNRIIFIGSEIQFYEYLYRRHNKNEKLYFDSEYRFIFNKTDFINE